METITPRYQRGPMRHLQSMQVTPQRGLLALTLLGGLVLTFWLTLRVVPLLSELRVRSPRVVLAADPAGDNMERDAGKITAGIPSAPPNASCGTFASPTDTDYPRLAMAPSSTAAETLPRIDSGGQVYNVRAYGAKGNGDDDDTAAIRVAVNRAAAARGVVFFPPGTYPSLFQVLSTTSHRRPRRCHLGLETGLLMATGDTFASASTTILRNYFVATNGSDRNPGTISQPFRTIAKGVSMLTAGETLFVRSGTYAESLQNTIPGGTSWSNPVTVEAYPGDAVTIRPPSGASFGLYFSGTNEQYIVVKGFTVDARNVAVDAVKITGGQSSRGAASHIEIANCEIEDSPQQGILTTDGADHNQFINLSVHNNGLNWHQHGMYIATSYNLVDSCDVHNNAGYGVTLDSVGSTIRNCKLHDNATAGAWGAGIIVSSESSNTQVYNNLIWNNNGGIQVDYGVSNTSVYNNTVYNNTKLYIGHDPSPNIYVGPGSTGAIIRNNICYIGFGFINQGVGTTAGHNLVGVNPLFVNAAADNFQLTAGSPAIGAGTSIGAPTTDINGNTKPQGRYDIGAYRRQ